MHDTQQAEGLPYHSPGQMQRSEMSPWVMIHRVDIEPSPAVETKLIGSWRLW